jgi:hypothetical protein
MREDATTRRARGISFCGETPCREGSKRHQGLQKDRCELAKRPVTYSWLLAAPAGGMLRPGALCEIFATVDFF